MAINADALKILLNLNGADTSTTITDSSENSTAITNNQGSYGFNSTDTSKFGSACGKFLNTRLSHIAVDIPHDSGSLTTTSVAVYDITLPVGTVIYNATRNKYAIVYDYGSNTVNIGGTPTDIDYFFVTPAITGQVAGDTIYYAGSDIVIPSTNISFNEDFSIGFWVQAGAAAGVILDTRSSLSDSDNFYVVLEDDDTLTVRNNYDNTKGVGAGKAGDTLLATTSSVSTVSFTYVEIVRKGSTFAIYIDETLEDYTSDWYNFSSNSNLQLGNVVGAGGAGFAGYIDEVQIWDGMSKQDVVSDIRTLESAEYSSDDVDLEVSNVVLQPEIEVTNLEVSNVVLQPEVEVTNIEVSNIVLQVEFDPDTITSYDFTGYIIEIDGDDWTAYADLPSIKIVVRDSFSNNAYLRIVSNSNAIKMGMELVIRNPTTMDIMFGGLLQQPKKILLSSEFMIYELYAEGYKQILGRRTFQVSEQNKYAGEIVQGVFDDFLESTSPTSEEFLEGNIDNGALVESYIKPVVSGMKLFNDLANSSGFEWWITNNKYFYFQDTPAYVDKTGSRCLTPDSSDSRYILCRNPPTYEEDSSKFRTRQFVIGKKLDGETIVGNYVDTAAETEMASRYGSGVFGNIITNRNISTEAEADDVAETEVKTYVNPAKIVFTTEEEINPLDLIKVDIDLLDISEETYKVVEVTRIINAAKQIINTAVCEKYIADTKQPRTWTDEFDEMLKNNADEGASEKLFDEYGGGTITTSDTRTVTAIVDTDKALNINYTIVGTCAGAGTVTVTIQVDAVTKKTFVFDVVAGNFSKTLSYPIQTISTSGSSSVTCQTATTVNLVVAANDLTFWVET